MLIFKSLTDLKQLPTDDPAFSTVEALLLGLAESAPDYSYHPDVHGYLVLLGPEDVGRVLPLPELHRRLEDVPWEGVTRESGLFHAVYIPNNQFCLSCLIPDAPWVNGRLRASLEANLSR